MCFPSPCECVSVKDMFGFWFACAFWLFFCLIGLGFLFMQLLGLGLFSYLYFKVGVGSTVFLRILSFQGVILNFRNVSAIVIS